MLRDPLRRALRRRPPRPLALTLSLATTAVSVVASAQCRVVPGDDGEVATWSVAAWAAGPSPRANVGATLGALLDGVPRRGVEWSALHPSASASLGWRPRSSPHAWIDLGAGVRRGGARVAVASLALRARTAGDRWLFVGADDALSVRLDGVERHRVARPRASREDDDAVRLPLSQGEHTLTLVVATRGELDLYARITDARFRPDPDLAFSLEGASAADCERLFVEGVALDVARAADPGGARVTLTASFPGGSVEGPGATTVSISEGATALASSPVSFGTSMAPVELSAVTRAPRVTVAAGGATRDVRVAIPASVSAALLRAREVLRRLDPRFDAPPSPLPYPPPALPAGVPVASLWSVEGVAERLASLAREADPDASHLADEAATLASLVDDLDAGRDPYARRTGALRRAYRSPLDGALQQYSVFVPPSFRRDRPWPTVVGLHGLHGSAHRMLPVLVGIYDESEDRTRAERHLPALPDLGAILVAPWGYGDSGYRQQGEYDVLRVVDEVTAAYGADPDRTYLTGLSMGGIGAAGVALHNPDRFAAMAPLCGYHSYFVRGDTRGVRRPWELAQMELRSNDRWAENALHTPMYLVHGTLDRPTANSQVLVDRFRALDYRAEVEWPALGHNVWGQTYANGRIVPYFTRFRRETAPRRVRFRTPDLHWNSSWWVTVDALATADGRLATAGLWGEVDVTFASDGAARGTTRGVGALTLHPPRALARGDTWRLTLDGDAVELPSGAPASLRRSDGHWARSERVVARGGRGVRDVFDAPLIFVVGSREPGVARLYERVARRWAHRSGVPTSYPIVRDDSFTAAMGAGRTVVLVGTPRDHRLLAALAPRLPVRVADDAVTVGGRRIAGDDLGVVFHAPHPDDPTRGVLVISGTSPVAVLRSNALPELLPQYVVYDGRVAPARGRVLLGPAASVLAAGYLDVEGRPLASDLDPVTADVGADAGAQ